MSPHTRMGLLAVGLTLGMFTVAGLLVGVLAVGSVASKQSTGPATSTASRKAENWDTRELADWLRANGLPKLEIVNVNGDTYFIINHHSRKDKGVNFSLPWQPTNTVIVWDLKNTKEAEAFVRSQDDRKIKHFWRWGKFVFKGDGEDLADVRNALR